MSNRPHFHTEGYISGHLRVQETYIFDAQRFHAGVRIKRTEVYKLLKELGIDLSLRNMIKLTLSEIENRIKLGNQENVKIALKITSL